MRTIGPAVWCVPLLTTLALVTGCSGDESAQPDDPYAADFRSALEKATSDFEKDVFADLDITKAEFDEAVQRYVQCAADRGVQIDTLEVGGYYNYRTVKSDEADTIGLECRAGTIELIEPLYVDRLMNPSKADVAELEYKCLIKKGVVVESYTIEQYKKDRSSNFTDAPFSTDDAGMVACMQNPSLG